MKLVLFGGVQGVGKTTLISWLEKKLKGRIVVLNPGELFRRYFYSRKAKTLDDIEEMVVNQLKKLPSDSTVVVHWHYAVRRPSGYIPQISFGRLKRIAESGKVERVVLLSVRASVDAVYKRRSADYKIKRSRAISKIAIDEEIKFDKEFLAKHKSLFSKILGNDRISVFLVTNDDLKKAQKVLYGFLKKLLS